MKWGSLVHEMVQMTAWNDADSIW